METTLLALLLALASASPARADGFVYAECGNKPETLKLPDCRCGTPILGARQFKIALYNQGRVPIDEMALYVNPYLKNADASLKKFNLKLDLESQYTVSATEDDWDKPIKDMAKLCSVVGGAFKAHPPSGGLPVFFLYLDSDQVLGGDAVAQNFNSETSRIECGSFMDVSAWPDFIVISARSPKTTTQVLLHEIGHAIGRLSKQTDKFAHRTGDSKNVMLTGGSVAKAEDVEMSTEQLSVVCGSSFVSAQ